MPIIRQIEEVINRLPEATQREVLDFAKSLERDRDREDWQAVGRAALSRAYGEDEPEYTTADIRRSDL